jgi:branched-chain amino acid transport system substrate-binding protein
MLARLTVIGLLTMGLLAGCSGGDGKTIKIALAVPLTGDDAAHGQGMKRGYEMAIEEANASGKLKGLKLELAEFDDRSDPKEAVTIANQIISDRRIVGVIGHLNSGCSIPASQVYARRDLVMITPASTNPKLTQQGLKNVFRICGTDDVQGSFCANYVFDTLKLSRATIIHDKTAYGQGLAEEFQKQYVAAGGTVTSFNGIDRGEKDYKALLTRIKTETPQIIYYGGLYAEGGLVSKQAKELGLSVPMMGGDGIFTNEYCRIAGKASEGDLASMVGLPPEKMPKAQDFLTRYHAKYPGKDVEPYDPLTYEATSMLVDALAAVSLDQSKLLDYISKIQYQGILGGTSFDERGDNRNKLISMNRVKDGKFEFYEHK